MKKCLVLLFVVFIFVLSYAKENVEKEITLFDQSNFRLPKNSLKLFRTRDPEVFLQGNFVEVGIHQSGSFGTAGNCPAGFHPMEGSKLGFVADMDMDGWNVGTPPQSGDYFLPGTPEEGWSIEWDYNGSEHNFGNYGRNGVFQIPQINLTVTSSGSTQSATWEGEASYGNQSINVVQTTHFDIDDLFFVMNVVLTNTGDVTLESVEYMRNVDPDQEQNITGNFTTSNYVAYQPGVGGNQNKALVVAEGLSYGITLGLGTINENAVVSTEGFSNRDPDEILNSPNAPGPDNPYVADKAIVLAYRFDSLAPGQSISFDYAYILNADDLEVALGDLASVTILQPTGTVSGENVLFQATTDDVPNTEQITFFVEDDSVGIDTEPDASGVFETTFNSLLYPEGTATIKAIATFSDSTVIEKTTTINIVNSGPPVNFLTPNTGQSFYGTNIPIEIDILDPDHPPVLVNFFRETPTTGSLSLGSDDSPPFQAFFDVDDLPSGENVVVKAVAEDEYGLSNVIQIAGFVNYPPIVYNDTKTITEDISENILLTGSDIDGNSLSFVILDEPLFGSLGSIIVVNDTSATVEYNPDENFYGTDSLTFSANDGNLDSNIGIIFIDVLPVNDPPEIISSPITEACEDSLYQYQVIVDDPDLPFDTLSFSLTIFPVGMTVDNETGLIEWVPTSTQIGDTLVSVRVEDTSFVFDEQNFNITVHQSDTNEPYITNLNPGNGQENVAVDTNIEFNILDDDSGININSVIVTVQDIEYSTTIGNLGYTGSVNDYAIVIDPINNFASNEEVFVEIAAEDLATYPNQLLNYNYSFNCESLLLADFSADQTSVNLGTEIQFTDLSSGNPTAWEWDFDNDGTIDSYDQNPAYTYPNPGTYTVSLTVSDSRTSQNFRMSAGLRNVDRKKNPKDSSRATSTETKVDYITVTGAQLTINPSALEFGNVVVDDFSSLNIELTNTGNEDIVIDSTFSVTPFTVSSNYNTTLSPSQMLSFPVTFQPTATLFYNEDLVIATDIDTFYVDLTGTGVAPTPAWSFNWTNYNFGQTDIDSGSYTNVTITNTGNTDLIISDCNISESHFDVSETSFLLETGSSQNITVSFNPEEILVYNGVISYTSEAGTQELNVSGNGYFQSAAPVLEYVVETRFDGTAGVEPEIGAPGTYFEYRITYTDADNDAPMSGFPQVGIDKNGDGDFLDPDEFMMPLTEIDPTDTNYADGKEYSFITQLPEDADLGYAFAAYDILGNPAIGEGTNYETGPTVTNDYLDLSIYANDITFSESNPEVGDEVIINAVIHNNSDYPADSILIRIYEEDILLSETIVGYLGAQSQTSISLEHIFTVPEYYPIKVVIDENDEITEANELNNFAIRPIVVGNYSVPGAIAATSYLNSSSAYSGGTLRFYGSAEYVETRLRNSVVSGAQVELTISGNGQSWNYTAYTDADGNYNIYFAAPQSNGYYTASAEVTDFTFTTQTSVHNFSVISPPPSGYPSQQDDLADLKINSCSLSGNPVINNMMEISGSFSNIGDLPAENVKLYLYLNSVLADSLFVDFLAVDESENYYFYQTWTTVGTHNVSVIVDPLDTVSEYIEYNNSASLSRYIYPEYADLTPVDILFDDNSPLTDQEITITGIIQNLNYIASDATTVEIYDVFSAEGRAESLLGIVNLEPINNGATQNIYFDHTFTAAGLHQIKLVVDPDDLVFESDETNQIIYEAINVEAPTAELTISAINVSNTNPDVGDAINFSATISNIGSNDAENFEVIFRLDDAQIGSNIPISSLIAGDNQIINSDAWIFDADPHTVEAVIDEANIIPELNEYNNETEKEIGVDLQARKNAIYPGNSNSNPLNIQMGSVVELKSRIYNHGTFAAENVPISYWIEDQLLEMDFVPLINNGVFIQSNIFTQFDSLGNFTVRIFADKQADGSGIFNEIDETNNFVDLYIHVYEESPDLEVLSQYIAPEELNPDPNEEIAIFASIFNQGNIDTDPFWVRILVDNVVLDDSIYVESLPALEDTTVVSNQLYSSAEIGTHTICVEADYNELLPEFDETNNAAVRNIIVGEAPDLAFADAGIILSDEEPEQGDLITISAFVKNTGGAEANGNVNWNYVINADTTLINSSNFSVAPQDSAYVSLQWFTAVPFGTIFAEIVNANPEEFNTLNNSAVVGFGSTIQQINTINAVNVAEDENNYVAADLDSIFQNVDETPLSYYFDTTNDSILVSIDSENQLILNYITNWFGSDESFTVTAENIYGDTISTTVSITVDPVNDAPQIVLPASITTYEDSVKIVDFSNFVSDPEQSLTELTLSYTESDTINIQIDGLQVTFSAPENWYGMETIEFSIDDNQDRGISYDDVIVIFNPVNDPPTIELPAEFSFEEDQSETFDLTNLVSDVDNELSELALSSSGSEHISVEIFDLSIAISSNTQHWNGSEMISISVSDDASRATRGDRDNISDSVMIHCIPVDDPPEFDLPQSLIFGPGETRQLDFDQYLNEYDGDDVFIQYMGNSNIIISNDSLLYSFSALDDYLGCENILFIVYDGTTFAPDQIAVCSSIVPHDVQLQLVGSDVEISWREITAASSYKVYSSDSPEGIFTEVTTGSFSQIDERFYWHDSFTEDKQFYRVTAFVEEATRGKCNKQEIHIDEELKEKIRQAYKKMYGIER